MAYEPQYYLDKFDKGEAFTENELRTLVWHYSIEDEAGDDGRWYRYMSSVIKLNDRYFDIEWDQGLTECQPDEYNEQPVELERIEYDKVIPEHVEHIIEYKQIVRHKQ